MTAAVDESGLTIRCPWHTNPGGLKCLGKRGTPHDPGKVKCLTCGTTVIVSRMRTGRDFFKSDWSD